MNLFSSSTAPENTVDAVLDIRSGSVGAALLDYDENGRPEIYWSHRQPVDFLTEHDTDRLIHMTQRALDKTTEQIRKIGLKKAEKKRERETALGDVRCFFAAPWQVGSPQEITITNENPFTVDKKQLQLAKGKAESLFSEDAVSRFGTKSENLKQLTTAVFSVWCNGYKLDDPIGVRTDNMRLATYVSMLPDRVRKLTENCISNHLHPEKLSLHSFTAAVHKTFTQAFNHPKTFLVINVDEEMTQLLVVNSGVLMGAVSYPLGSHFLIRTLAKALDAPAADARSRLKQFEDDEAQAQTQSTVNDVIEKARDRWQELLVSSLEQFSENVSIPTYAFVLSNHVTSPTFADFAGDISARKHLVVSDSFRIHEVTDDLLADHTTATDHVDHYLGMASLVETFD
jgi:hypothetical protein